MTALSTYKHPQVALQCTSEVALSKISYASMSTIVSIQQSEPHRKPQSIILGPLSEFRVTDSPSDHRDHPSPSQSSGRSPSLLLHLFFSPNRPPSCILLDSSACRTPRPFRSPTLLIGEIFTQRRSATRPPWHVHLTSLMDQCTSIFAGGLEYGLNLSC